MIWSPKRVDFFVRGGLGDLHPPFPSPFPSNFSCLPRTSFIPRKFQWHQQPVLTKAPVPPSSAPVTNGRWRKEAPDSSSSSKMKVYMKSMYLKHLFQEAELFFIFQQISRRNPSHAQASSFFQGVALGQAKGWLEEMSCLISKSRKSFAIFRGYNIQPLYRLEIVKSTALDWKTMTYYDFVKSQTILCHFCSSPPRQMPSQQPRYTNKCTPRHPKWMEWNAKMDKTHANMGFYMFMPVWKSISQLLGVFAQRQSRASEACSAKSAAATPWKGGKLSSVFQ